MGDAEAIDGAAADRPHPLRHRGEAARAERARIEPARAAVAAALEVELVANQRFPEAVRLLVDARQRFPVRLRLRHHAVPRIIVTPLSRWSRQAPVPLTGASRAPTSSRSRPPISEWRTASAAPRTATGDGRRSRARSSEVRTRAPPPSEMTQQSSR